MVSSPATERTSSKTSCIGALPMKSEIVVMRCSLATRTSLRSTVGQVSATSAGPR